MTGLKLNVLKESNHNYKDTDSNVFFFVNAGNCCFETSKLSVKSNAPKVVTFLAGSGT